MSRPPLIHVVDDDESLRTALLRLLEAAGFEARGHASTGAFLLDPVTDRPGCVLLDVRLEGPSGFDLHEAMKGPGLGLTSMTERLKVVGGRLSIHSQPGRGTTIDAVAPLRPPTNSPHPR